MLAYAIFKTCQFTWGAHEQKEGAVVHAGGAEGDPASNGAGSEPQRDVQDAGPRTELEGRTDGVLPDTPQTCQWQIGRDSEGPCERQAGVHQNWQDPDGSHHTRMLCLAHADELKHIQFNRSKSKRRS